ncbi:MAG: 4-hydroxyphenylpyruvate dioxygenase [Halobacteriovoraceae bacterium]|nr:4-hydroxyphenylpyruvate dioxygenase [Halobacteriovoraceae bacterium]MBT5093624.1 4-hydroxyphenylpyruvate dioxygenase [Halobacteriovoraceae bacterium]
MTDTNPIGLTGIEWVEFGSPEPEALHQLFTQFGFSLLSLHRDKDVAYYNQNDINFLLNRHPFSFAHDFYKSHGPSICSMGWRVKNANKAFKMAIQRGAKAAVKTDYDRPAIYGIGNSLIYFIETSDNLYQDLGFEGLENPRKVKSKGFTYIDHLTNNVEEGTMAKWTKFYKEVFGFTEVRYFDIKGAKTGLTSFALRSPDGSFCIPINEATDKKSQINEYLEEYKGAGIQHLAFCTEDIVSSVASLQSNTKIETLDIDDEYYAEVFDRVPNVTEDQEKLKELQILVDGDEKGYLLQIFTKNVVGPIFIEIIQRKNHQSFGEGNFGALFRSIERDQEKRGYLK